MISKVVTACRFLVLIALRGPDKKGLINKDKTCFILQDECSQRAKSDIPASIGV